MLMVVCMQEHLLSPWSPKELYNIHVQKRQDGLFIKSLNRKPGELTPVPDSGKLLPANLGNPLRKTEAHELYQ